ncbi:MAG: aminopeptidase N [Oligoflexia bacterium]|nr:aminopeptidase N [Oligoflexia bacterium]
MSAPSSTPSQPQTVFLKDYRVPEFLVETIDLRFELSEEHTDVTATVRFLRNPASTNPSAPLVLDGERLELRSLKLDGRPLAAGEYRVTLTELHIESVPRSFTLETVTRIKPQENLALEGLYKSGGMFCTQCEAQGFRKITYYPDRPDVMAAFTTTIIADRARYPVLLSNGNRIEVSEQPGGRHLARWRDPFKKPAYLFALVAGDLGRVDDQFVTKSGRKVKLEIYTDKGNEDRAGHGMDSLKKAMRWDEEVFGLEYDLDIFMIVAVADFNFGAMENKGLNVFNAAAILAKPSTATDSDYQRIEGVVAHEYFHNWTGNRVTCRDWFQLSLKEGLTVYRDQEFSADVTSRAVHRIEEVIGLRNQQFSEDAGPMAHPIRPSSYIEINNFYTATVYSKGAEVIRMIATLLGREGFRKGMDKYFELFDGQAVTTDDFVRAMELANGADLTQFRETWYEQSGTPRLRVKGVYDAAAKRYTLEVAQACPPTPGQPTKRPYHLPLSMALLDQSGGELASRVLPLKKEEETFEFNGVQEKPVPSLLRGFSAPVHLEFEYTDAELLFLLSRDGDAFARFEAGQKLALRVLGGLIRAEQEKKPLSVDAAYLDALMSLARDRSLEAAFRALLLEIPSESYIGQLQSAIDVDAIHTARDFLVRAVARHGETTFRELYQALGEEDRTYRYQPAAVGRRALRRSCLRFLTALGEPRYLDLAAAQVKEGRNMTEEVAALLALTDVPSPQREEAFRHFYDKWKDDSLTINKWLQTQAVSSAPGGLDRIKALIKDPVFNINNPNKVRSVFTVFGQENLVNFHAADGSAYRFMADQILDIDRRNANVSARLAGLFNQWRKFDPARQALMRKELERMVAHEGLSAGVFEIVSKALK